MPRYLLYFSYIGTQFMGSQRQLLPSKDVDPRTVQGLLEGALTLILKRYRQDLPRKAWLKLSSRTDSGVHAFVNTAHFDRTCEQRGIRLAPEQVTIAMNKALRDFRKYDDICVLRTRIVPDDFHCRHNTVSRSYMYRLAVVDAGADMSHCTVNQCWSLLPLVEQSRCHVVPSSHFNFGAFHAVMQLFRGCHNFAGFMKQPLKGQPLETCVKQLDLQVVPGQPFLNRCHDPLYENLQFYEIHIQARSFLYKQVRNMVGAAIAVGMDKITYEQVRFMLENPKETFTGQHLHTHPAPAHALFLTDVHYNSLDLELPNTNTKAHSPEPPYERDS